MKFIISKKDNLKDSIPLMSLLISLNLILIILMTYLPYLSMVLFLLMPLPSIIYFLYIKFKYYYIYFLSSFLLGLLVSIGDISYCLTSLLPILLITPLIGFLLNKKVDIFLIIIISSVLMFLINIGLIYLLNFIYNIDFITNIIVLLKLNNNEVINLLLPTIIYLVTLAQIFIMTFINFKEINSINKISFLNIYNDLIGVIVTLVFTLITLVTYFFDIKIFILLLVISFISSLNIFVFKRKYLQNSIIFLVFLILAWILYIIILPNFSYINALFITLLLPIALSIYKIIYLLIDKIKHHDKRIN